MSAPTGCFFLSIRSKLIFQSSTSAWCELTNPGEDSGFYKWTQEVVVQHQMIGICQNFNFEFDVVFNGPKHDETVLYCYREICVSFISLVP